MLAPLICRRCTLKTVPESKADGGGSGDLTSVGASKPGATGTVGICCICPPALGSVCPQAPGASNKTQQVDHLFLSIGILSKVEPQTNGDDTFEDAGFHGPSRFADTPSVNI